MDIWYYFRIVAYLAQFYIIYSRSLIILQHRFSGVDLVFLDEETGEIVVGKRIDREQTAWLNFTVKATDSGRPPRAATADVYVQVGGVQSAELPTAASGVRSLVGGECLSSFFITALSVRWDHSRAMARSIHHSLPASCCFSASDFLVHSFAVTPVPFLSFEPL